MDLKQIRNDVEDLCDYKPDNVEWKNLLDRSINKAYLEIWTAKPWIFAHKEAFVNIYRDVSPSYGATNVTLSINNGSRRATFSGVVHGFGMDWYEDTWQGQVLEIEGVDYEISSIESETVLLLKTPYRDTTSDLSASTDWKLKHRYYRLPDDCVNLLTWSQVDRPVTGQHTICSVLEPIPANNRGVFINDTTSNWATYIYRESDINIPAANGKTILQSTNSTNTDAIPDGTYVQFTWAYGYAGRVGSLATPSDITQLDAGAGSYNTVIVAAQDSRANAITSGSNPSDWATRPVPYPREGLKKYYFFNANIDQTTGEAVGEPCWVYVSRQNPNETSNLDWRPLTTAWTSSQVTITYDEQLNPEGKRHSYTPIQQVRPWPRIDTADVSYPYEDAKDPYYYPYVPFKQVVIQYIRKPEQLIMDSDTPDMPPEFHNLIVYKTLENIYIRNKQDNRSSFYIGKYERELKALQRRYSTTIHTGRTREPWSFHRKFSMNWNSPVSVS